MKPERCPLEWVANEDGDTLKCTLHEGHDGDHIGNPDDLIPAPFQQCRVKWVTGDGLREQCLLDRRHYGPHSAIGAQGVEGP